jgi:hypothetical protein
MLSQSFPNCQYQFSELVITSCGRFAQRSAAAAAIATGEAPPMLISVTIR